MEPATVGLGMKSQLRVHSAVLSPSVGSRVARHKSGECSRKRSLRTARLSVLPADQVIVYGPAHPLIQRWLSDFALCYAATVDVPSRVVFTLAPSRSTGTARRSARATTSARLASGWRNLALPSTRRTPPLSDVSRDGVTSPVAISWISAPVQVVRDAFRRPRSAQHASRVSRLLVTTTTGRCGGRRPVPARPRR